MGGLGTPNIPLLADFNKKMSRDFGVLDEEEGISLRYMVCCCTSLVIQGCTQGVSLYTT